MRNTQIFIALLLVLIGSGMAQAATIEVCSTCGNTTFNNAMAFAIDGDVIDVTGDLLIENMNTVDNVRIEGNNHRITISLPLGNFGIKALNSTVLNNISIDVVNAWAGAIQMESTDVIWNNIHIEANDSLGDSGKIFPNSAGIGVMRANNSKIINFTTKNVYTPLWIRYTDNFTVDLYNISATRNYLTEGDSLSGVYIDDSTNVSLYNHIAIQGYPNGIRIGALTGSTSKNSKNITISGTGKIHGNVYGLRGEVDNFTIIDAILEDNTNDMGLWGLTTYTITNVTASRMVLLPNGKSMNVSNYALDKVNVEGTTYDVSAGYGLTVSALSGSPPYNLTLSYNKSKVTELNLDTASLRVLHINAPNETLVPSSIDTARGTLTVQTSSFSPFVIYGVRLSTPSTTSSSSGGGGGGGGSGSGGVVTDEDFANVNNYQSIDGNLQAGKEVRYDFNKVGTGIFYATVTGKENEYGVTIRVENLKAQSKKATTPAPNTVYLYTNILSSSQRIQSAKISFKVPNTWLDSNKIDRNTVKMYRLINGSWSALETKPIGSDAGNSTYEAVTAGFSKFAITGVPAPTATPEQTPEVPTAAETTVNPPVSTPTPPQPPDGTPVAQAPGFGALLAIAGLLAVAYLSRKAK